MEYEVRTWSSKYSTCLAITTTLGLTLGASHSAAGGTVVATATLKVADVASYVRLALNPLPGRTVVLQRRPRGTVTWTTVGTMFAGATAGTYTRSIVVSGTTNYRAVFTTPTDEGLRGATSRIVSIVLD